MLKHMHQCALQLQTINMDLDKDSRTLLVKLFYQNNNNGAAALREYRRIKESRSEFRINWRFENCSWRGRRPIVPETFQEVTVAMAENAERNVRSSSSEALLLLF